MCGWNDSVRDDVLLAAAYLLTTQSLVVYQYLDRQVLDFLPRRAAILRYFLSEEQNWEGGAVECRQSERLARKDEAQ
ncbi:hypothetical protein IF1G_08765 [Cordyceps javanica]|uniref:Uncharacterized protein n=1 Tax=Cordyceps javanica TaxID=43265 RepID=A0A545UTP6_9HYPO|nr:hypothetical protein IF1G_08765 [Cordyceps javanica]